MSSSSERSLCAEIAEWAVSVRRSDIPDRVLDAARVQLRAIVAAVYGGHRSPPVIAARRAALALGTRGRATVLPTGESAHPYAVVLANAAASMAHDFDDYLFLGHTGHSAVLASLAAAEHAGSSIEELLVAQTVANEVAGRLGAYVAIGPQNGQMWSHIHLAASAVAAARLWNLSAEQTANALGCAFYQAPFTLFPGFFGSDAKVMTAAAPAASGLWAAMAAEGGMRGAPRILEHPQGFGHHFAFIPIPEMVAGLGSSWVSLSLSCKIYPGCAYIDGPVDAAVLALGDRTLSASEIEGVDIAATLLTTGMERLGESASPTSSLEPIAVNFSAKRSVAIALLAGGLDSRLLEGEWLHARGADVRAVAERTRLRHSSELTRAMIEGLALGVDLPALARTIGVARIAGARTAIRRSYGAVFARPTAAPRPRRSLRGRLRRGREAIGAIGALIASLRESDRPFDMAQADFDRLEFRFGAEVSIRLRGGGRLEGSQSIPLGAAGRSLLHRSEVTAAKLRAEAAATGMDAAAPAFEQALAGGGLASDLTAAICAAKRPALPGASS